MIRRVRWSSRAVADGEAIARRDTDLARRIRRRVATWSETGEGDVKKLAGTDDEWRLRVGDWRVIFWLDRDAQAYVITRVLPRKDAYRD